VKHTNGGEEDCESRVGNYSWVNRREGSRSTEIQNIAGAEGGGGLLLEREREKLLFNVYFYYKGKT